ncbi:crotonase/enoyl-CoA hydratase family protein [Aurantiacibacter poecillastricola]|uniref:crotonase/enoyl-CoA hydratase family protein n=1 Tax=Aurantiacibacter poecillastricola TaxID=3064385 RepID=UPI002740159D|nr:crotonase/enoyl-CoA hydratase family protein [Aurantiacibacter sp. 219JJ12-13]MDP5261348.1 crotonase/enoyl-CoA hydratase family protein [Aurantiacibacter sp. 219JJ12-13]
MADFNTLDLEIDNGLAVATFNRPDKMNTFNPAMIADLLALFDLTDADDAVRAVILTGSGRAFCAGADLGGGGETFDYDKRQRADDIGGPDRDGGGMVTLRIFRSLKPVIAASNGAAVGIGATMQLPMDWRVAAEDSRYGFVFSRRGVTPEACSGWFLPRLVGMPKALDWTYSGRVFGAQEALEAGLVQSLHPADGLLDAAKEKALEMTASSAPVSVALARQLMWQGQTMAHPMDMHRVDSRVFASRGRSADVREGIAAFKEKREASYPDTVPEGLPDMDWAREPSFE